MGSHKPAPITAWQEAERAELARWAQRGFEAIEAEGERLWLAPLKKVVATLDPKAEAVELFPGPLCATAKVWPPKQCTFIEPLADDIKRLFPGRLPKKVRFIRMPIERLEPPRARFGLGVWLDALHRPHNPEVAISTLDQMLAPKARVVIAARVYPRPVAMLHYFALRAMPHALARRTRLYRYAEMAFVRMIARRFTITRQRTLAEDRLSRILWVEAEKV
ncbi:MAG: hypothetical protein D6771_03285 [Zetaproteobacteria bacterium]|nr:MAG: hypothetical protein D6771_03285 [Zetaproteobacteria bacterium]